MTPARLADLLPSRPVLSRPADGRSNLVLQRPRHSPAAIDVPGLRHHLVVRDLAGSVLVEESSSPRHLGRR